MASVVVSRPGELHPQPLSERCGSLSTHTAPIKQTCQPSLTASFVALNSFLLFPVELQMQPLDPTPLLRPHYRGFIARTGWSAPVPCIGTLASRFVPLVLLPCHQGDWFPQFRTRARARFTPPIRRPPPAQLPGIRQACPRRIRSPWFRRASTVYDASTEVHLRSSL